MNDIDYDLHKHSSSDQSSDIGRVSSTGVGSTTTSSSESSSTTTISFIPPVVNERPARPLFTRISNEMKLFIESSYSSVIF